MYTIATLQQLRQRLGLSPDDTADDPRLLAALQAATAQMEAAALRRFIPRRVSIGHTLNPRYPTELVLVDDLLELDTLVNGDGRTIAPEHIVTVPHSAYDGPVALVELIEGESFVWTETPVQAITVSGIWGWHDRWSQAWRGSSDTVQDAALDSTTTTLTVTDADGLDAHGTIPRFQVGQLLRLGSEYVWVTGVDTVNNTLTVKRGANGTTAAAHAQYTAIEIYQPPLDVEMLCLRWALWLYKEPDNRPFSSTPLQLSAALGALRRVGARS
jgi:hypothetical protein